MSAVANATIFSAAVLDHEKPKIPRVSGPGGLEPAAQPLNSGEFCREQ
jgi:hypothetical protein